LTSRSPPPFYRVRFCNRFDDIRHTVFFIFFPPHQDPWTLHRASRKPPHVRDKVFHPVAVGGVLLSFFLHFVTRRSFFLHCFFHIGLRSPRRTSCSLESVSVCNARGFCLSYFACFPGSLCTRYCFFWWSKSSPRLLSLAAFALIFFGYLPLPFFSGPSFLSSCLALGSLPTIGNKSAFFFSNLFPS